MTQEIMRTYVTYDTGEMKLIDTIEHEGSLWLVPYWLDTPYPKMRKPARMIRLPKEGLRDLGRRFLGSDIRAHKLDDPIPKAVVDGTSQSAWPHGVLEAPDLMIRR
jgi:hypothetical protein